MISSSHVARGWIRRALQQWLAVVERRPWFRRLTRAALLARGLLGLGRRFRCPCCGWTLRGFVRRRGVWPSSLDGYCPRCDAKARHRRDWLYLERQTDLLTAPLALLEVAPWWALSRRLRAMANIHYVSVDLMRRPEVTTVGDVAALPFRSGAFDALICIHVLEHVENDRGAMAELFRVLRPGGWALVTVPVHLDRATYEDPSITDPDERARAFGERGHVRAYGRDLVDRLRSAGFEVELDPAGAIPERAIRRHGLRRDEHVFRCRRPIESRPGPSRDAPARSRTGEAIPASA